MIPQSRLSGCSLLRVSTSIFDYHSAIHKNITEKNLWAWIDMMKENMGLTMYLAKVEHLVLGT